MIGGGLSDYRIWKMCERDPVLREVVTMTGWLEATEKTALMQSADVFVILRRETRESAASFPTRLPEYLATGRPVIASAAGDIPEYLEHGVTAWLVPPDDRGELLCSAFVTLHAHPELGDAIGRAGFDEAVKRFSIEENGRKMDAFIRSLALGASAGKAAPAH
jgi:glycosyltransferase involved in cell wall biosynthesis